MILIAPITMSPMRSLSTLHSHLVLMYIVSRVSQCGRSAQYPNLFSPSLRKRVLGLAPSPRGHAARRVPWLDVSISYHTVDSKYLSTRTADGICHSNTGDDCSCRATCYAGGAGVSPLSSALGRGMGCEFITPLQLGTHENSTDFILELSTEINDC